MSAPLERAYELVQRRLGSFISELCECARIPSVSSEPSPALEEMAGWLRERLAQLDFTVELVPVPGYAPLVIGRLPGLSRRRLVLYSHYDVQPANPIADWSHDPFGANIEGDVIYARGICDDKADIASRLHAIQVWRDANGELPFDVVWLSEGAEEIGSPGLAAACSEHSEQLRGDGCLWESYLRRADGRPEIAFGCKGLLYVELSLRALASDQHSSYAGVFRSAPIRLVQALATLVGPDGRPRIDGFEGTYDEPSTEELRQLDLLELPDGTAASQTGKTPFQDSCSREDLLKRLFLEPSVNISGLASGFQGAGSKTIIPASAGAKVDFRLIQNQSPEMVASLLESHLASRGFDDIVVETLSAVRGAQSDRNSVIGKSVLQAACEVMGAPIVYPIVPGSGPMHVIVEGLKTPTVTGPGSLRMDSGMHGPDEHIRVTDYQDEILFLIRLFSLFGNESDGD